MASEISKEELSRIMGLRGQVRGVVLKTDEAYVLKEKGEDGVKLVEGRLIELGHPIKYSEIRTMDFYPVSLRILSLAVIREVFKFTDKDIEAMGNFATKKSLIIKLFMKYFLSLKRVVMQEAPEMWKKHWTIGKLVPMEVNEKEKYATLRLEDFKLHPMYCVYLKGYFTGILQMIVRSPRIDAQETKCAFKNDEYHEYTVRWQ